MTRRKGFTLIELLVVIAIIAILAAILFPVFARAREKARQASCQSNLKQIALAVLMYVEDHDEIFPFWATFTADGSYQPMPVYPGNNYVVLWADAIYPYVKNTQIFVCPSMRGDWIGYSWNANLGDEGNYRNTAPRWTGVSLASVPEPAGTGMIVDRKIITYYNPPDVFWESKGGYFPVMGTDNLTDLTWAHNPHNEGSNIVFVDGHAKWYRAGTWADINFPTTEMRPTTGIRWYP